MATHTKTPASEFVIDVDGLTKRYANVVAVDALTLRIPRQGVFGLLGPNGSGKTTTIAMVLGLVTPSGGTVRLFGADSPHALRQARRRIGSSIESPAFYGYLSGRRNLEYFQRVRGARDDREIERLLDVVSLDSAADRPFAEYSMGMKQRLGIARALLGGAEVAVLDEPTNGLDPHGVLEVREVLSRLAGEGRTIVLCSHVLPEVEQLCRKVAIMSRGRLVVSGDVADLLGTGTAFAIRTTDDERARVVLARSASTRVTGTRDGALVIEVADGCAGDVGRLLAGAEIYLTEMVPFRKSLQEFFIEATRDAAPASSECCA